MSFNSILGNRRAKSILSRSLRRQRLPNSLLFTGPEGVGKEDAALVVAKALNCLKLNDDACEECASCRAVNRRSFPDVLVVEPENDSHRIERMRMLKSSAYLRPMVGKKRVYIISEAEKMKEEAANSLLKILEEPPPFTCIILLASNPYLILPTIQSRCQMLPFFPVNKEEIEEMLVEKGYREDRARIVSHFVDGSLKQALSLDWDELQEKRQKGWTVFLSLLKKEKTSFSFRDQMSSRSPDKQDLAEMFEILSSFCRDVVLIKGGGDMRHFLNQDYGAKMEEAAAFTDLDRTLDLMGKIEYSLYALKRNCNVRLLICHLYSSFLAHDHV